MVGTSLVARQPAGRRAAPRIVDRPFHRPAEASPLERQLAPLAKRLRRQYILESLPRAFFVVALVALATVALARLGGLPGLAWLGLAVAPIAGLIVVIRAVRRRYGPFEAARRTDAALALRERLATALEVLDRGLDGPVVERQVRDATAIAGTLDPCAAFPLFVPGSEARRVALRRTGLSTAALAAAAALLFWPPAGGAFSPNGGRELALADPSRLGESIVRPDPSGADGDSPRFDAVEGRTQRPDQVGETTEGLLGQSPAAQSGPQGGGEAGQQGQQAQQDARSQQSASMAERQEALQDLGSALRQTQTGRPAGDSLRRGDTQRAGQQLEQLADQVSRLSSGERQMLSQAFREAAQQIGDKDRELAGASQRAADALSQYRNQDAQQAIRDAANQVRSTGQQAQAQQQLEQRARELERGGQPQLPSGQQGQQAPGNQQSQQGQQGQQAGQQPRQGGNSGQDGQSAQGAGGLAELEAALRGGGLSGEGAGSGAGSGSGGDTQGRAQRLAVEARPVHVEAEVRDGPTQWRPPSPNAAPAAPPPAAPVPSGPASAAPVGAGPDVNTVPWDLAGSVRQYFTPEQNRP
ncbi:MAG: hypothetical protein HY332_20220 [Chloroflexi bacterium]|nr:hypothetical protein [Chloroflexota bacterium]